ncbi:MAG: hypothetical protein R3323_09655, partial [Wenzhouxiangellaceae bacterium]|nr:hypothetical protein [Wenzhouxiangellaceae bacterium]
LFGERGPSLDRYRFQTATAAPDLGQVELLGLRRDLHAVFDASGLHLGVIKNLRGRWVFRSVGYDDHGRPREGAGPCAASHMQRVEAPETRLVLRLLRAKR